MPNNSLTANNLAAGNLRFFGAGPYLANNLATTQPRQDTAPVFKCIVIATSLASGAAGLGSPALSQVKVTLSAANLVSQSAALSTPPLNGSFPFSSITNYATTSPTLDGGRPSIALKALYNFSANNLAAGAAALGKSSIVQLQTITTSNLASGAAGIDTPQFVQFNALTATNLAAGAAGFGTPTIGNAYAQLAPSLNFASVDTSISQLNAALAGLAPTTALVSVGNIAALIASTAPGAAGLKVSAAIAIPNKAALSVAAALAARALRTMPNSAAISSAALLKANAATFIFDTESFAPSLSFGAYAAQNKDGISAIVAAANLIVNEAIGRSALAGLSGSASMFGDLTFPATITWFGFAKFAPSSNLSNAAKQIVSVGVSLNTLSSLVSDIQLYVSGTGFSIESILQVSIAARQLIRTSLAPSAELDIYEQVRVASRSSLSASTSFTGFISTGRPLSVGISPLSAMVSFANISGKVGSAFASTTSVAAKEIQNRATGIAFAPAPSFTINLHSRILPSAIFTAQTALVINERVLPFSTAFYFVTPHLTILAQQTMLAKAAMPSVAVLTPHEGLNMLQAPSVIHSAALMTANEDFILGPNLTLVSNIILGARTIGLTAVKSNFVSGTNLDIQYTFNESCAAYLTNSSNMTMLPSASVSGLVAMFTGCYFNIDITQQRTVEQGPVIIAQQSNNRIVAQGNLVILNS